MKRIFFFFLFLGLIFEAGSQLPVYVNLVSHNEDGYVYLDNPEAYYLARDRIVAFARLCAQKGAKWNYGSDYVLLLAVQNYDTASVLDNTNGKNLLKWLSEDMGVECDPHTHSSKYNYADIAYLHTLLDVTPSGVISGILYNTDQNGDLWMDYQDSVPGLWYPDYKWKPDIIWGGGTPGHTADPEYWGMWKPLDTAHFFEHNPEGHLIDYGQGCRLVISQQSAQEMIDILDTLIAKRENGEIPENGFYCTSIFFEEADLNRPAYRIRLDSIIDLINERVAQGKMEWKNISEVAEIWKTQYDENPFYVSCGYDEIYTQTQPVFITRDFSLSPNPANNHLTVKNIPEDALYLYLTDLTGKCFYSAFYPGKETEIDISALTQGIYMVNCLTKNGTVSLKFVKQ